MNIRSKVPAATVFFTCAVVLHAQLTVPQTTIPGAAPNETVLQIHVRSVLVPVVVRDKQGHAVGNLKEENFKVFDQGKRRTIIGFTPVRAEPVEGAQPAVTASASGPANGSNAQPQAQAPAPTPAKRFIVFLFDDRHLGVVELEQVKRAGIRMLERPFATEQRAVVLSFLGVNSGITHDSVPLQAAISKLKPAQINQRDPGQCPYIDYYTADQILNKHSKTEWDIAYEQTLNCTHKGLGAGPANGVGYIEQLVRSAAEEALATGDQDVRATLAYLRDVVHTMSKLPGQRTLILVSPGFFAGTNEALALQSQILDLAASANVTISTLDAQGVSGGFVGASQSTSGSVFANITGQPLQHQLQSMHENQDAMEELAEGTGGTFFHNDDDLAGGLKTLASVPEYTYLLEFSLQDVKANGTYHALKVEVDQSGLTLQARRGYFAPSPAGKK